MITITTITTIITISTIIHRGYLMNIRYIISSLSSKLQFFVFFCMHCEVLMIEIIRNWDLDLHFGYISLTSIILLCYFWLQWIQEQGTSMSVSGSLDASNIPSSLRRSSDSHRSFASRRSSVVSNVSRGSNPRDMAMEARDRLDERFRSAALISQRFSFSLPLSLYIVTILYCYVSLILKISQLY